MVVLLTGEHLVSGEQVEFGVEGVSRRLVGLEALHLVSLLHPGAEDAAHTLYHRLSELERLAAVVINTPEGDSTQTPVKILNTTLLTR